MTQIHHKAPNHESNFSEYEQMLSEVKNYWRRGDITSVCVKLSESGVVRNTKSMPYLRMRMGRVLNQKVRDIEVLAEMHKHIKPRKKLLAMG